MCSEIQNRNKSLEIVEVVYSIDFHNVPIFYNCGLWAPPGLFHINQTLLRYSRNQGKSVEIMSVNRSHSLNWPVKTS